MKPDYPKIYLYKRIVQAKIYMDTHFDEPIDLHNISDEAFFSKFHFLRLFKNIYGKTPHQYLTYVRVEKAKEWLQQGSPVSETCYRVGFDSLTSFTALFRKHTKMNPSAYRRQWMERRLQLGERPLLFIPNCFAENYGWVKNSNFQEADPKGK